MHRLVEHQLKSAIGSAGAVDLDAFSALVSEAYQEIDHERSRTDRSIAVMVEELEELAQGLKKRQQELEVTSVHLRATLDNIAEGVLMTDAQGAILALNDQVGHLLGVPETILRVGGDLHAMAAWQKAHGEFDGHDAAFIASICAVPPPSRLMDYELRRPDGRIIAVQSCVIADGACVYTYKDVTDIHEREQALRAAELEYRSLFENATVGIYRVTVDGQLIHANDAMARMNGYPDEQAFLAACTGQLANPYADPRQRADFIAAIMRDGKVTDFVSLMKRHANGETFWASEAAWAVCDKDGKLIMIEGMLQDATDRKNAQDAIEHAAMHDLLTGLANRTRFMRALQERLALRGRGQNIAVFYLDLDHFKDINDTMGHEVGDIMLRIVARRLTRVAPPGALCARFGGDEYALLVPGITTREAMAPIAERIAARMAKPFRINGNHLYIGVSIGMVHSGSDGLEAAELLKKADIALNRSKFNSRGTYLAFEPHMIEEVQARRTIEAELRRAISEHEFCVVYQPIIDVSTGQPMSYETLLRWRHPSRGLLSPAEFIKVAEDTGQIIQIGEMVLKQACADVVALPHKPSIAVNLSSVQFRNHQLGASVVTALAMSGLAPTRLVLEITESVLLQNDVRTMEVLQQLRELGVKIALDDFGTGQSSFGYLQKFPFDKIKIDRAFVQDRDNGPMNRAIRRAVLGLGRDLDIEVICEGVETAEISASLVAEGCRYMQGYLFGRPLPAAEAFRAFTSSLATTA